MADIQKMPDRIGKYTILERIGRGGMGYVYRAHDPILKRDVAIKTMLKDVSEDEELRSRFLREAQSAGGLRHPNIVTVYDMGEDSQGCPYIAMEFLTGTDLEQIIKNKMDLPLSKKLDIIFQTCQGLGFAHANGIVHRDVKAGNIRLLDNGECKIMDFGIAKMSASHLTRTGMIMGTPHYMAPEQIRGGKIDGRADIFSLGVVLYELLVYRKPYPGENPTTVLFKIVHEEPDPLVDMMFSPPPGLEEIVLRALAKIPDERYQTCEELAEDLHHIYMQMQHTEEGFGATVVTPQYGAISLIKKSSTTPTPGGMLPSKMKRQRTPIPAQQTPESQELVPAPKVIGNPTLENHGNEAFSDSVTPGTQISPDSALPFDSQQLSPPGTQVIESLEPPLKKVSSRRLWKAGAMAALGVTLFFVVLMGFIARENSSIQVNKPMVHTQPNVKPAPPPQIPVDQKFGWLSLNIQPWAEISDMKDSKGRSVSPPISITPCKMRLNTGSYEITLTNSRFKTMVIRVEVKENQIVEINKKLEGFDHAKALDSLGL